MTKEQEWARRLREQARSGLSASEWCRQKGLSDKAFYYWKKRLKAVEMADGGFVKVGSKEPVELVVREGLILRVPGDFDAGSLKRLLEVLSC